jgi:iron complex outermembrane receptor protein
MIKGSTGTIGANFYGMFYNDQLIPTGQLSNVGYPIMTNVKTSYRAGIELTAELRLINRIDWKLSSTLSSNKIKGFKEYYTGYMSDGTSGYFEKYMGTTSIAYSPGFIASSDLEYSFGELINLHFISKYVGKQYFDNTMSNARSIDPYFVNNVRIDLNVPVRKLKAMEFTFQAINIFNSLYESNAYGGFWFENGTEKTWAYYFPQAGINFLLSASVKF